MPEYSEDRSLRTQYARALSEQRALGNLLPSSSEYRAKLEEAILRLQSCQELAATLAIFSPNETLEDLATGDLPYMSIEYHLGDLYTRTPAESDGTHQRQAALKQAQESYGAFLNRLESYELLSRPDAQLLERWSSSRNTFELLGGPSADAAARRAHKIARYQHGKDLKQKLANLGNLGESSVTKQDDDAPRRSHALAQLALETHQTFEALDLIAAEQMLLARASSFNPGPSSSGSTDDPRRRRNAEDDYSERLDPSLRTLLNNGNVRGPLLDKKGRPQQPFVLTDARTQVRQGVFRPGHRLPTMSIDEYLEAERARGGIIEGGGEQSGQPPEIDEDNVAAVDRETEKQRAWDEFKEDNPKGSGNTLNRG